MAAPRHPWLRIPDPRAGAPFRLFCFPFGGAGASAFRSWPKGLPAEVELCAVQLPGREDRLREPLSTDLNELVQTLLAVLGEELDRPYAFYGHSMGALIGFELARELRRRGWRQPLGLFVSSRPAPQLPPSTLHKLSDPELAEVVRSVDGTPQAVLHNPKWLKLFLRILRADILMCETHPYVEEEPLDLPIHVYSGREDPVVPVEAAKAWRAQTRSRFALELFSGGHFFHLADSAPLMRALSRESLALLAAADCPDARSGGGAAHMAETDHGHRAD